MPYVRKPKPSAKAKMGAGVYDARYANKKVTLTKAPWEDDDGCSDLGLRDVLRQGVQPIEDDDRGVHS